MAQMKAYTMPMKNLTLICVPEFLCRKVLKKSMCAAIVGENVFHVCGTGGLRDFLTAIQVQNNNEFFFLGLTLSKEVQSSDSKR